jgi:hypothetical protein
MTWNMHKVLLQYMSKKHLEAYSVRPLICAVDPAVFGIDLEDYLIGMYITPATGQSQCSEEP